MARSSSVDPLEKFRFIVEWSSDGNSEGTALVRAGFHDIQMPKRTTNKGTYREGIDPDVSQLFAGLSTMEDVTLSRGLLAGAADKQELYKWARSVHKGSPTDGSLDVTVARSRPAASNTYRKDITIKMLDRAGGVARQWLLSNAFPVSFVSGSDLNASEDGEKSLEQLTLAYEDFMEVVPGSSDDVAG